MRHGLLLIPFALLLILPACSGQNNDDSAATTAEIAAKGSFTGTVRETVHAGGYTYARVEKGGKSLWAAARETDLPVGTEVSFSTAMPMQNWHSESLDRTWDTVYFTGTFEVAGQGGTSADPHQGMGMGQGMPDGMGADPHASIGSGTPSQVPAGSIEKAAGGVTIGELWSQRAERAGQKLAVRGRVVKFNGGIMDRNWVHLQDGSGDAAASTNDLTVTTNGTCKVGDVVTVTGTVVIDKDFGSGYRYGLILEDARVEIDTPSAGTH